MYYCEFGVSYPCVYTSISQPMTHATSLLLVPYFISILFIFVHVVACCMCGCYLHLVCLLLWLELPNQKNAGADTLVIESPQLQNGHATSPASVTTDSSSDTLPPSIVQDLCDVSATVGDKVELVLKTSGELAGVSRCFSFTISHCVIYSHVGIPVILTMKI